MFDKWLVKFLLLHFLQLKALSGCDARKVITCHIKESEHFLGYCIRNEHFWGKLYQNSRISQRNRSQIRKNLK